MEVRELRIAEDLLKACDIRECELRCWKLHREGYSFYALKRMLRKSASTLWKWYQKVQHLVEQEESRLDLEGRPLAGVTIYNAGNEETETPFRKDQCLDALGF